jgi:OOP family OmpA-OmpF porin
MQKIVSIIALATAALTTPFLANANDYYVKGSIGKSHYRDFGVGIPDESANGGSLGLGYVIDKNWDAEIGYTHFGTAKLKDTDGQISLKTQTIYAAGIGKLPITDAFSVFGKAGLAFNYSKASADGTPYSSSKTNTALLLGAGLSYQFTKEIAAIIDYTYYGKGKTVNEGTEFKLDQVSLGLKYNF